MSIVKIHRLASLSWICWSSPRECGLESKSAWSSYWGYFLSSLSTPSGALYVTIPHFRILTTEDHTTKTSICNSHPMTERTHFPRRSRWKSLFKVLPNEKYRGKFSHGAHCNDGKRLERQLRLLHSRGVREIIHSSPCEIIYSAQAGGPTGMNEVVAHFKKLNGAKGWGEWEVDQVWTSCCTFFILFFVRLNIY